MSQRVEQADRATAAPDRLVQSWVPAAGLVLALAGLALAGYLTVEHYTASTTLACPETGRLNCRTVTTGPHAAVLGISVAVLGLPFFAAMTGLSLPAAWASRRPLIRTGRLGTAVVGVAFVGYLVYTELFVVNAICLYCTAVHVLAVALFVVTLLGTAYADPEDLR